MDRDGDATARGNELDHDAAHDRFLGLAHQELDRAYRLAGLLLGRRDDAEDATHDALVKAWGSVMTLRDPAKFQAWFDRILVNVCRDRMRRGRQVRFIDLATTDEPSDVSDPFAVVLDHDAASNAIRALDADLRTIVVLRYWADLTVDQIADRIGVPAGTVKSRLHRALGLLRAEIEARAEREATT